MENFFFWSKIVKAGLIIVVVDGTREVGGKKRSGRIYHGEPKRSLGGGKNLESMKRAYAKTTKDIKPKNPAAASTR